MDRDEAIRLLRDGEAGVLAWNEWREGDEDIPDLQGAELSGAELSGAELSEAELFRADLRGACLSEAHLHRADLRGARLSDADLRGADLRRTYLSGADLRRASLIEADFRGAFLSRADLGWATCARTAFGDVDLSEVKGLESIQHLAPSTLGVDTLAKSLGRITDAFLRGCGLAPWEVLSANLYRPELTPPELAELQYRIFDAWTKGRSMINGSFISYSWKDAKFVDKLCERLSEEGINVWLDRHDMVAGTIQDQVWRQIQRLHVVIIVLSEASVESDWVENELDMARTKEKAEGRAVLCPIALDDAWRAKAEAKDSPGDPSRQLWRTLTQKLIVDFAGWKTKAFEESFQKLLRGLKRNYGPGSPGSP